MDDVTSIPAPTRQPTLGMPGDQPSYAVGKDAYTFVATGADTGGAFARFDGLISPGGGPPPHCHGYEETLFVIEGELTVFDNQSRTVLTKDAVLNIPGWTPHILKNFTSSPARVICVAFPPGLEGQFAEVGHRVPDRNSPAPALSAAEQERVAKLIPGSSGRHDARMLPGHMFDDLLDQPEP